jgi:hypothetical protein
VSWNVANRVGEATRRQGEFLARLDPRPDVILLQEVNRRSVDALCEFAGMGWLRCAVDLRQEQPDDRPVRRRGVAIAGRTAAPSSCYLLEDVPLPERLLIAALPLAGQVVHLASYHAPPGMSWFEKKPQQAVRFARWLATLRGPAAFGADANTPLIDAIDFQQTRTHWHTGRRILRGAPGDDLLVGPAKLHRLEDVLRRWLDGHPDELDRLPSWNLEVHDLLTTLPDRQQANYGDWTIPVWLATRYVPAGAWQARRGGWSSWTAERHGRLRAEGSENRPP